MSKRNIGKALNISLQQEKSAIGKRFDTVDYVLGNTPKANPVEKIHVIRDTFTCPEDDYNLIDLIQKKAMGMGKLMNKSEIIRAGLRALMTLTSDDLKFCLEGVKKLKTKKEGIGYFV